MILRCSLYASSAVRQPCWSVLAQMMVMEEALFTWTLGLKFVSARTVVYADLDPFASGRCTKSAFMYEEI